jgi:hypothetical protein
MEASLAKHFMRYYLKINPFTEKGCGVAQSIGPEFQHQYCKKKKKEKKKKFRSIY